MILLGKKYKFTKFEKQKLKKKKIKTITVRYTDKESTEVIDEIENLISKRKYKQIVLNTDEKVDDELIKYLTKIQLKNSDIQIITLEHFMKKYLKKCYIPNDNISLNYLDDIKPFTTIQYMQKRVVDFIGILILFIITSPVLFYSRIKINRESPGDCIYKQLRIGKNGHSFNCIKFRSMHLNSHHDPYTQKDDIRIFPWGQFMRKTRIDELPQLLNVLKGDMHLIGPRAEWNILVDKYEKDIPYYNERHIVRPGITGWAQVNYPYGSNIEDTRQKLMYDLYYIKYWSITLEIKVIWKTILVVLGRKGI